MNKSLDIAGKVIIVTGAAGRLGREYTLSMRDEGAQVIAWDKSIEKLEQAFENEERVTTRAVDITIEGEVEMAVRDTERLFGRIDALVNNAAMNPAVGSEEVGQLFAPYEEYSIELFRKELDANVTGMMIVMKHVARLMMKQKAGSIINVASEVSSIAHDHRVYASPGRYKSPAYTASKTAVLGLTRQWAARLGEHGVRVNAISIGGVRSPGVPDDFAARFGAMNMLGRMANPGEYNATIQYLCSDASSFMTGANMIVDGGKSAW